MINDLTEAISIALDGEFGGRYEIHMEEIRQGLEEPCFFIQCLNPSSELLRGKKYFRRNPFCIQYFPESSEKRRECNSVAERMLQCLEYIRVAGNLVRGTKMEYEVEMEEGVLNFFVNYDRYVYKMEQQAPMEEMEGNVGVKG